MPHTLYDTLEISPSASREAVVDAYRQLHARLAARINGIDGADQDTLDRAEAVREAFAVLADPERRRDYDRQLAGGAAAQMQSRSPLLKPALLVITIGLFVVGYGRLLSELEATRQERERVKAEAMRVDLQLQQLREEQRLAAQADFQRRRNEAMERFLREQAESGSQFIESDPHRQFRS
ncbi:MAG TPA: DnaJ domain-containing protein [Rhodocyclaceae bacterium]|nr:DnaJ domain-containing protein [Rhodocyclaceae bacterium]